MCWKPHEKLSAAFEGNKTVRTNGTPFCLVPWNVACSGAFRSVPLEISQLWSSVDATQANSL